METTNTDVIDNPQMGTTTTTTTTTAAPIQVQVGHKLISKPDCFNYTDIPSWYEITGEPSFNIGIVINSRTTTDRYTKAISKPGSSCDVKSLVILNDEEEKSESEESSSMEKWLEEHQLVEDAKDISLSWGDQAFRELIKRPDIDAVYIIVPPGYVKKRRATVQHVHVPNKCCFAS
jgi:hypothetical protein